MAQTVSNILFDEDREALEAIAADRRAARVGRPALRRWQLRYAEEGVDGLLRNKTRKPGRAPRSQKVVARVLELT
jgi:hypothetical protein